MAGAKIQAVNQGIQLIHNELLNNPQALDTVHIAVITFNTTAQMASPMVDLLNFKPPTLTAEGVTSLADALNVLNQSLDRDILANTPQQKGDYKPLVFLLTDGIPTDQQGHPSENWRPAIQTIRNRTKNKAGTIITLGIGGDDEIDENVLKSIGDVALKMTNVNADTMQSFFKWVSASVSTASVAANRGQEGGAQVQQPPAAIQLVF
jgi:uncharacterized protein YegL